MVKHKVKSAALQLAIFVALLIALLLSGLILYAYTNTYVKEQSKAAIENIRFADSGIQYLLSIEILKSDTLSLGLFEKGHQSVKVNLSQWGIFQKAYSLAQHRKKKFAKSAIVGVSNNSNSPALYLKQNFMPLTLVGKTMIRGMACLPSQGVKPGYINGESYDGNELIYGTTKSSGAQLPKISKEVLDGLLFYCERYKPDSTQIPVSTAAKQQTIHSFFSKTRGVRSANPILLKDISISGNIIIKSDTLIKVSRTAILKDILLIAPIVEIEDGTSGNFQVIATQKITVGKKCNLNYPSALVLLRNRLKNIPYIPGKPNEDCIVIGSESIVRGSICVFQEQEINDFLPQIILEKNSLIKGQVYCEGNFELNGKVSGSVYTKQFILKRSGTTYVNYIYNGTIENESIPDSFGGILFEDKPKTVMQWLY